MRRPTIRRLAAVVVLGLLASACSTSGSAATIDGVEITSDRIETLHAAGAELDEQQRASTLFLIILHHLVTREAEAQFDLVPSDAEIEAALAVRLSDDEEVAAARLADRGVSRERVLLEAELDVLREKLQRAFVERGGPDIDLDAAYRTFLGVNSRACVTLLAPASDEAIPDIERATTGAITLQAVQDELGNLVEPVDLGCDLPTQLPGPVQPIALDGEVGRAYLSTFSDGTVYVAGVTSRDAPPLETVIEEVKAIASDSQGSDLFDEWAFDLLRTADVTVDANLGAWKPRDGTGDVPTVVPNGDRSD